MRECPLTRERNRLGFSRYELAAAAETHYEAIAGAEAGRRSFIPVPVLNFLCEFCGVDVVSLQREFSEWYQELVEKLRADAAARARAIPNGAAGHLRAGGE